MLIPNHRFLICVLLRRRVSDEQKPVCMLKLLSKINAVSAVSDCQSKRGAVGMKQVTIVKLLQGAGSYHTIRWFTGGSSIDGETCAATWNAQ